jgi:hypothetical protein
MDGSSDFKLAAGICLDCINRINDFDLREQDVELSVYKFRCGKCGKERRTVSKINVEYTKAGYVTKSKRFCIKFSVAIMIIGCFSPFLFYKYMGFAMSLILSAVSIFICSIGYDEATKRY